MEEAESSGNLRATARKFKVQPSQIRQWRKNLSKIQDAAKISPQKLTVHAGKSVEFPEMEEEFICWKWLRVRRWK